MLQGASGNEPTKSLNRRAGAVARPSVGTSASTLALIVRSRFVPVTLRRPSPASSSTLLRAGSVERGDTAREARCNAALNDAAGTAHFIFWSRLYCWHV